MEDGAVELARPDDADALVDLRDRLADWLAGRGIDQWTAGELPREQMAAWIEHQAIHVVRRGGQPIAAVAVLWEDPDIWGTDDGRAGYVHLLMVDRARAGTGLGDRMLGRAEQHIRHAGRPLARLDAVSTNRVLTRWYRRRGYQPVGTRTFPGTDWYDTTLYEKALL